ncbi:MAG: hypothetical protein JWM34_485 [Ilumatobacteraceae bacterium]|nr:hypothetical protein [Ilumatobacteraceae bacterium]
MSFAISDTQSKPHRSRLRHAGPLIAVVILTTLPIGLIATAASAGNTPGCTANAVIAAPAGQAKYTFNAGAAGCYTFVTKRLCVEIVDGSSGAVLDGPHCTGWSTSSSRNTTTYPLSCTLGGHPSARSKAWLETEPVDSTKYGLDTSGFAYCSISGKQAVVPVPGGVQTPSSDVPAPSDAAPSVSIPL